jgi:molybdopterin converting factor small subunit
MIVRLLAFGIAKDILGERSMPFELQEGRTIGDLKSALMVTYERFAHLSSIAFAVHENYVDDGFVLHEGDEVVLIPPVSGG